MEKILEGSLARFEVPDLLSFLSQGGRTGVLVLERPDCESKLFFRDGRPVFASSSADELRFGPMLVRMGRLTEAALERAMRRHAGGRVGQALVSERLLTEEQLGACLKVQVSEVVFHALSWRSGLFSFYGGVPPPATAVTLEMDLLNLLLEGVRRLDPGPRVAEWFPDRDMVVVALVNPERVKQAAVLTQEEWQVLFLVDGRRSVKEICRLVGGSDSRAMLLNLYRLLRARLVAVLPAPPEAPRVPTRSALTQIAADGPPPVPPEARPAVEFSSGVRFHRPADDTAEIVSKKAVPYLANATRLTVARLVLLSDGSETSFPLTRDSYTLGRHRNNDIVVADPKVSSFHARLDRGPEGFAVVDLKSRNGCWVNGRRVESALLDSGDELRVGAARLVYKVDYTSAV
jgi:hypothetical protein